MFEKEDNYFFDTSLAIFDKSRLESTFEGSYYFQTGKLIEKAIRGKKRIADELIYGPQTKEIQLKASAQHNVDLLTIKGKVPDANQTTYQILSTSQQNQSQQEKGSSIDYSVSNISGFGLRSESFIDQTVEILKTHNFTKVTSLTSLMYFHFTDTRFIFGVYAVDGTELSRANGTYQVSQSIDNSIAKISLFRDGPIQKSAYYADNDGIDTELFLSFNSELLLQIPTKKVLSRFNMLDLLMMKDDMPEYILQGRDAFPSTKIESQAGKDSIANEQRKKEEKKRILEEKLKGF